jgi:hypothetical protein
MVRKRMLRKKQVKPTVQIKLFLWNAKLSPNMPSQELNPTASIHDSFEGKYSMY